MSNLSEFADIIRRQGEEKRARDLAVAKELEEGLSQFKASLAAMSIEDLFEGYDNALNGGYSCNQILAVLMTRKGMIRDEIISRTKP